MALTNFAKLTEEQKTVWSMDLWKQAREQSFLNKFLGKGPNSLVQHITELKKSEKGTRAVITLVADLEGDGVVGDRLLEGNEEAIKSYDQVIQIDQIRHGHRSEGRIAEQKSIVDFRKTARDVLAYWLADRIDQLAFQTLGGVSYALKPDGTARTDSQFSQLEFAAANTAPSNKRVGSWTSTNGLTVGAGATSTYTGGFTQKNSLPCWDLFLELKKYARETYMRGVRNGGEETFHAFLTPEAMMLLKQDPVFRENLRHAQTRGDQNDLFTGNSVKIDGVVLHEFLHVPHASTGYGGLQQADDYNATPAGYTHKGSQILFCGAQALAYADIGAPSWDEEKFDYSNQCGIATAKIAGFLRPKFKNQYVNDVAPQDFGVINVHVCHDKTAAV